MRCFATRRCLLRGGGTAVLIQVLKRKLPVLTSARPQVTGDLDRLKVAWSGVRCGLPGVMCVMCLWLCCFRRRSIRVLRATKRRASAGRAGGAVGAVGASASALLAARLAATSAWVQKRGEMCEMYDYFRVGVLLLFKFFLSASGEEDGAEGSLHTLQGGPYRALPSSQVANKHSCKQASNLPLPQLFCQGRCDSGGWTLGPDITPKLRISESTKQKGKHDEPRTLPSLQGLAVHFAAASLQLLTRLFTAFGPVLLAFQSFHATAHANLRNQRGGSSQHGTIRYM